MLKFTIIVAALTLSNNATGYLLKDTLITMVSREIDNAKIQLQMFESASRYFFTIDLARNMFQLWQKTIYDIEQMEEHGKYHASCDPREKITDSITQTITNYDSCSEKVRELINADINSVISEGNDLIKEIENAENVTKKLRRKVIDFNAKSVPFNTYDDKLENCLPDMKRLERNISSTLATYKRCLRRKL